MKPFYKGVLVGFLGSLVIEIILTAILFGALKNETARSAICEGTEEGSAAKSLCDYTEAKPDAKLPEGSLAKENSAASGQDLIDRLFPPKLNEVFKEKSYDFSDPVEPVIDSMDYPNDQPQRPSVPSIEYLLKNKIASRLFNKVSELKVTNANMPMADQAVSRKPVVMNLIFKDHLSPLNKTVCLAGSELFYHCTHQMLLLNLSDADCKSFVLPKTLSCCPKDYLVENCENLVKNDTVLMDYLSSPDYVQNFLFSSVFRDRTHSLYLKAYQILAESFNVNLEFPLFFSRYKGDAVGDGTLEYRRFLSDGTLFCYYYDANAYSGKAKASPCPPKTRSTKLDMSDMQNYKVREGNVIEFNPPTWKEYCKRSKTVC